MFQLWLSCSLWREVFGYSLRDLFSLFENLGESRRRDHPLSLFFEIHTGLAVFENSSAWYLSYHLRDVILLRDVSFKACGRQAFVKVEMLLNLRLKYFGSTPSENFSLSTTLNARPWGNQWMISPWSMFRRSIENNFWGKVADGLPDCPSSLDEMSTECIADMWSLNLSASKYS